MTFPQRADVVHDKLAMKLYSLKYLLREIYGENNFDVSVIVNSKLIMQSTRDGDNIIPTTPKIDRVRKPAKRSDNILEFKKKV